MGTGVLYRDRFKVATSVGTAGFSSEKTRTLEPELMYSHGPSTSTSTCGTSGELVVQGMASANTVGPYVTVGSAAVAFTCPKLKGGVSVERSTAVSVDDPVAPGQ